MYYMVHFLSMAVFLFMELKKHCSHLTAFYILQIPYEGKLSNAIF